VNSFKIGDRIVFPNQGLGIIEDLMEEDLFGQKLLFYHIRIFSNNTLVLVPSANTEEMGLRKPIAEETIDEIFDLLKNGTVDVTANWKGRFREHSNMMKSGTIVDVISVLKSLYYLSLSKPLSFREKKMMEKARELIVSELSEATSLPVSKIERKLTETLTFFFKNAKPSIGF
jgi:CarD family transcriptional regulator